MNREERLESDADSDGDLDVEVGRLFNAYLEEREAGRAGDLDALCAAHPHLADRLRACLEVMDWADAAAKRTEYGGEAWGRSEGDIVHGEGNDPSSVLLRDLPGVPVPVLHPAPTLLSAGRYRLLGEIARGGMGAVLKGHDSELGRELAVKVLLKRHCGNADIVRRFTEEAQIGGQLQHPGIVPVYDVGSLSDRQPFFAMKLVQGRTLAALLADRANAAHDRARLLGIFEQVCQTVAYAHARGVVHRDLKPSNVMVGSFGEVQVMDWGLAKVLARGGIADDGGTGVEVPAVLVVRGGPGGDASQAGSVLGTPAYMSPEQARGEVERVDEPADVFALGSILCEVLTGAPTYRGRSSVEVRGMAARAELADALGRLAACDGDEELRGLAIRCLASNPADRPREAGELAQRVQSYMQSVQERLRAAELARAKAQARAESERARRRLTFALASAVLALAALGGGGSAYLWSQRAERRAAFALAIQERLERVVLLGGRAAAAPVGDLTPWAVALAEAKAAEELLRQGEPDRLLVKRVRAARTELETARVAAEARARNAAAEHRLVERLAMIRSDRSDWDMNRAGREYAAAFREFGVDFDRIGPRQAGAMLAGRSTSVEIAAALDEWHLIAGPLPTPGPAGALQRKLSEAARTVDPDAWRDTLRSLQAIPSADGIKELIRLANDTDALERQPAASLFLLALTLRHAGQRLKSTELLRAAWSRFPDDFWITYTLGTGPCKHENIPNYKYDSDNIRFLTAAIALRPRSQAAHSSLAIALRAMGNLDGALAECRAALRMNPGDPVAHFDLGVVLGATEDRDGAIAEYYAALRLNPNFGNAHYNLGVNLKAKGDLNGAVAEFRAALRLDPNFPKAHHALGRALVDQQDLDGAIAEFREMLRLEPNMVAAHNNIGNALKIKGDFDGAIAEYRKALSEQPNFPEGHLNIVLAMTAKGDFDAAIVECREALRMRPDYPEAHCTLGHTLQRQGKFAEALRELERGHELGSQNPRWGYPSAQWIQNCRRLVAVDDRLPAVLEGTDQPADIDETVRFAEIAHLRKSFAGATRLWSKALAARPNLADDLRIQPRYNGACSAVLASTAEGNDGSATDPSARAQLRQQALEWLSADLDTWARVLRAAPPQIRPQVVQTLEHWKADSDLASVRDVATVVHLPDDEHTKWVALWSRVDLLLMDTRMPANPFVPRP